MLPRTQLKLLLLLLLLLVLPLHPIMDPSSSIVDLSLHYSPLSIPSPLFFVPLLPFQLFFQHLEATNPNFNWPLPLQQIYTSLTHHTTPHHTNQDDLHHHCLRLLFLAPVNKKVLRACN